MGFLDMFKTKKNQKTKKVVASDYVNDYEVEVTLRYIYPEFFDIEKINENLSSFFNDYFAENPANEFNYDGMNMLSSKSFGIDVCYVKIVFQEKIVEFLDDDQSFFLKKKIRDFTSISIDSITIEYTDFNEKTKEFKSAKELLAILESDKELNKTLEEMEESTKKLNEIVKKMEEENKEREKFIERISRFL